MARKQLGAAPSDAADTTTKAYVDSAVETVSDAVDAITNAKGDPNGFASLDGDGLVPQEQLPITTASWDTLEGKPAVVAAGATKAAARAAIDAIDTVVQTGSEIQFYSGSTLIGDPVSLVAVVVDGGTPSSTSSGTIDGGTP